MYKQEQLKSHIPDGLLNVFGGNYIHRYSILNIFHLVKEKVKVHYSCEVALNKNTDITYVMLYMYSWPVLGVMHY